MMIDVPGEEKWNSSEECVFRNLVKLNLKRKEARTQQDYGVVPLFRWDLFTTFTGIRMFNDAFLLFLTGMLIQHRKKDGVHLLTMKIY